MLNFRLANYFDDFVPFSMRIGFPTIKKETAQSCAKVISKVIFRLTEAPTKLFGAIILLLSLYTPDALGQVKPEPTPPEQAAEVVRINTDLVQTDVMVFDKRGRFVEGLRREDFELRIDGKPLPISFFDRVTAGSRSEESQLAAARGESSTLKKGDSSVPVPLDRGRTVFFFVDDLHLSANSLVSARNVLFHYIEKEIGQNDQAAITSASGQIGFLQQITDNKAVLRAAAGRLKMRSTVVRDSQRPPMSEYQALAIERNDREVISYFVDEIMKEMPSLPSIASTQVGTLPTNRPEQEVRNRARLILQEAAFITRNTLSGLESLVRSVGKLPGRKLIFFISSGFFLDARNSDSFERLRQITSSAARNGVVIYSMDARGLVTGGPDASSDVSVDPSGRLQRIAGGELIESQDALNALAKDTGGRTIFNTNSLDSGIHKALDETSAYYLLAWRPQSDEQKSEKFRRIEVSVIGRPELIVRSRAGFFAVEPASAANRIRTNTQNPQATNGEKVSDTRLHAALLAPVPEEGLPVSLNLTYVNNPDKGLTLTVALEINAAALSFPEEDKKQATVRITGLVYNDEGKVGASFNDLVTIAAPATNSGSNGARGFIYNYPLKIPPGLYQVRVGVSDEKSGKVGSAQEWIEIPDLSSGRLALSSVIASQRKSQPTAIGDAVTSPQTEPLDLSTITVDRRFQRNSFLRFLVFIYSRPPVASQPDIAVQVQILRDDQPVLTTSQRKVSTDGVSDLSRLAYAAEILLEHLPIGRYVLQVSAVDRIAKTSALQRMRFEIR